MLPPEIQLTLFVPGLFHAPLATAPEKLAEELVLPVLERLLARSGVQGAPAVGKVSSEPCSMRSGRRDPFP